MRRGLFALTISVLVLGSPWYTDALYAQDAKNATPGNGTLSQADREFMEKAAQGGMFEVDLGKAVAKSATNEGVKGFATRMVNDHSEANNQLKALAGMKEITLPQQLDAEHKDEMNEVLNAGKDDLDRKYMETMVKDHQHDVAEFENKQKAGGDPDLQAWVSKQVPVLKDHLMAARALDKQLESSR